MAKCVVHLNAGNDRNGNPRRLFVVMDRGVIVDVVVEGYGGEEELRRRHPALRAGAQFRVTPGQYQELKRRARGTRAMMSGARRRRRG